MAEETKDTNYYSVQHPLTGETKTTIVEASSMAKARAYIEKGLIQIRKATAKELVDCAGKVEKAE